MEDILDLCWEVFPWISNQATCLGLETEDNRFAHLGGELLILTQISFSGQIKINSKLVKVAELVNKACSVSEILISVQSAENAPKLSNPWNNSLPRSREPMSKSMGRLMHFGGSWSART